MTYQIQAGNLYAAMPGHPETPLAFLQKPSYYTQKILLSSDGTSPLYTDIKIGTLHGRFQKKTYVLSEQDGSHILVGVPVYPESYAACDCHISAKSMQASHMAILDYEKNSYALYKKDSQSYCMMDAANRISVELFHNDTCGGWTMETSVSWKPAVLLGFFIFCRYLDQDDGFMII